jgi:hypothetical protein
MKDVSYKRGIEKKQIWKFDISLATQEPACRQGERKKAGPKEQERWALIILSLASRRLGFGQGRRGDPKETPGAS